MKKNNPAQWLLRSRAHWRSLIVLPLLGSLLFLAACDNFERTALIVISDADAAVESMTTNWEKWKTEDPRQFTIKELENFRVALNLANEAVGTAEGSFSAYWELKKLVIAGKKSQLELEAARNQVTGALEGLKRAVDSARIIFAEMAKKRASAGQADLESIELAGLDLSFLAVLLGMLGEFASAIVGGKKGRITQAAVEMVAAVLHAHQRATGEDIDLALPALRARIAERRKRLANK